MSQIFTVVMPDIGEGVMEGEVVHWLKKLNDPLMQDEPVVTLMTDKATVELPAPYPGKLAKIYYQEGQIALRDKPLYDIEVDENIVLKQAEKKPEPSQQEKQQVVKTEKAPTTINKTSTARSLAAPPTRKLAQNLGIDIDQVNGTGPEGRVTNDDVVRYHAGVCQPEISQTQPLHLSGDSEEAITGIRNLMSKKMSEAHRIVPQFAYFERFDATRLVQLRLKFKEAGVKEGIAITFMPFIIKALSLTLKKYPVVNSSVDQASNKIILHKHHNIGIAIASKGGLIVPVLKDVQNMTIEEVIRKYSELREKAMNNKLLPSDMKESTITISNFGVLEGGGVWATPIVNYPEVAILGIGRIHKHPVVRNDEVVIRDVLNLSWGFDHRIVDGELAAHVSHEMSSLLQDPAPLMS
jgi:pyruvate dehydrogenase E2 component (dihydrolipoamide acetyltransferase)